MRSRKMMVSAAFVIAVLLLAAATAGAQQKVQHLGKLTAVTVSGKAQGLTAADYANAKPMPMPSIDAQEAAEFFEMEAAAAEGPAGFVPGGVGDLVGKFAPVKIPVPVGYDSEAIAPQEHGTSNHPFTTSRVDLTGYNVSRLYPYAPTGKLWFKIGSSSYMCSASLIKKGVIVTAAHCVAEFGKSRFYSNWTFTPGQAGSTGPWGTWTARSAIIMTVYYNGTDYCAPGARGVVCRNDIAVITLNTKSGYYPGSYTSWYGYGWNGWGFVGGKALINQLGYPYSHDAGIRMQRSDSQGFVGSSTTNAGNTIWGTRQTGGSSGGPELVNLGPGASLSGTAYGTYSNRDIVVGVTSWGYTNTAVKQQGASAFTSSNIPLLVAEACKVSGVC